MTTKALKKQLFVAIAMVIISVIALSGSTYAWFAMNRAVTATGLDVTVQADSIYLLISKTNTTAASIQAENSVTADFGMVQGDVLIKPSAHNPATGSPGVGSSAVTNTSTASTVGHWYYKNADSPTASASTKEAHALTDFDGYVIHDIVYITLAKGSVDATNLVASATIVSNASYSGDANDATFAATRVLVTSSTAYVEFTPSVTSSATVLAATVTDDTVIQIDIFIYYDGNDSTVYTNNAMNLDGATINIEFSVDDT